MSAPVAFMGNIVAPWSIARARTRSRCLTSVFFKLVALADIGAFVATLVERRQRVFGKRFDFEEQAKILSQAIGRPVTYQEIPIEGARQQSEDAALTFEWFDKTGYDVDSGGPLGACV